MLNLIKNNLVLILNIVIVLFLLILPYVIFENKLYISGDDTRLYYSYPFEYFKEHTFTSWHHFSSVGSYSTTQFMAPFLLIWSFLSIFISSKVVLSYFGFSLPLILGFVFLQLFIKEILSISKNNVVPLLGSLFFITSPIIAINQYFIFLSTIWLLPLIPFTSLLLLRYLKTGHPKYLLINMIGWISLSLALYSIPWYLGYVVPLFLSILIIYPVIKIKNKLIYIKRFIVYFTVLLLSQSFWIVPFIMTYFGKSDINFGSKILSKGVADTFAPTVLATATGDVIYPLLNLFHRKIVFDFGWALGSVFTSFYDKIILLNSFFFILIISGFILSKKYLDSNKRKIYFALFIAFIISLYFFTVNIGFLKDSFLLFGKIPGFVMFRNFFDKFALAYVIFYAILISFSLEIIRKANIKIFYFCTLLLTLLILINFTQLGKIVNAPLWQTKDVGRNINIPFEYLDFMRNINMKISSTNNIFTVPFGTALYSVIKDENSDNVYTGTSPVKMFSGINDISGFLSFYFSDAKGIIEYLIINKDYVNLVKMLNIYNVNYLFVNKNIPDKVLNSWVFDKRMNVAQDEKFIKMIAEDKPVLSSSKGNYLLYKLKKPNSLLVSNNLYFKKVNEVKFKLYIKNLNENQPLFFNDSYQNGWKLYPIENPSLDWCQYPILVNQTSECKEEFAFIEGDEIDYTLKKSIFEKTHKPYSNYFINNWIINKKEIVNNFDKNFYKTNKDGSIDLELILYFKPQNNFYFGITISTIVFALVIFYTINYLRKIKNEKN